MKELNIILVSFLKVSSVICNPILCSITLCYSSGCGLAETS